MLYKQNSNLGVATGIGTVLNFKFSEIQFYFLLVILPCMTDKDTRNNFFHMLRDINSGVGWNGLSLSFNTSNLHQELFLGYSQYKERKMI